MTIPRVDVIGLSRSMNLSLDSQDPRISQTNLVDLPFNRDQRHLPTVNLKLNGVLVQRFLRVHLKVSFEIRIGNV